MQKAIDMWHKLVKNYPTIYHSVVNENCFNSSNLCVQHVEKYHLTHVQQKEKLSKSVIEDMLISFRSKLTN